MIHDKICESRKVNSISFEAEALWVRLLTKADDNGNYYRDVKRVYANCMLEKPSATEKSTEKSLGELLKIGLIKEYEADGRTYLHLVDFHQHQDLPGDRYCRIEHPLHPASMGGAYMSEGLRRDTWREKSRSIEEGIKEVFGSHRGAAREWVGSDSGESADQVEVKDKGEGKEEVESPTHPDGNFKRFQEAFRDAVGRATKPKPYPTAVERYTELCRRFGEDEVLDAINAYVDLHGKAALYKNKYADRNFLNDEAEDLIKAKRDGTLQPPEEEEVSRVAGPRGVAPENMR